MEFETRQVGCYRFSTELVWIQSNFKKTWREDQLLEKFEKTW